MPDHPVGGGITPGALHVVATPIGNLADLSPRAADILRTVALVVAEDTRVARVLMQSIDAATTVIALPGYDEAERVGPIVERLVRGEAVALISDAGTPLVSDPGSRLVAAAIARGVRIIPIPGASALLAAIVASGVVGARWSFEGFLPRVGADRTAALEIIAADGRASVIFEAGGRVAQTLSDLSERCGTDRPAAVCREMTKLHEEIRRGTLASLAAEARAGDIDGRGEFVIVVGESDVAAAPTADDPEGPYAAAHLVVERAVAAGETRSRAIRRIAELWRLDRRRLWNAVHDGPPPSEGAVE